MTELQALLEVAAGRQKAELVLKNANVVDVFTCSVFHADVALFGGRVAGVGAYSGERELNLNGKFVAPGFLDAHVHIESSMTRPAVFGRALLPWGTTAVVADPHELANVAGLAGVRYLLEDSAKSPVDIFFSLPSCVPLNKREHNGAALTAQELAELLEDPRVVGLGEVMDFQGVAAGSADLLEKIELFRGKTIDGHAPGAAGALLQAYRAAGVQTDHECATWEEARERLRAGFYVQVREGSAAHNLCDIISGALREGVPTDRLLFCTDDLHLSDIAAHGSILHNLRLAAGLGMKPEAALRIATLNTALAYGLRGRGAVAAGYQADLVVLDDLADFHIAAVYKNGRPIEELLRGEAPVTNARGLYNSVHVPPLAPQHFALRPQGAFPVIGVVPGQLITTKEMRALPCDVEGLFVPGGDLLKLAVVQRHDGSGRTGVGAVRGFGLREGAVASTVAHDSHNLVVVGSNDADMHLAVDALRDVGGGYAAVRGGRVLCTVPLPVGGLFAEDAAVAAQLADMKSVCLSLGVDARLDVFQNLSFLSLPVIPALRMTDEGVFDVLENRLLT